MEHPLDAWLALARVPGLHAGRIGPMQDAGLGPTRLLDAPADDLVGLGLDESLVRAARKPVDASSLAADRAWLAGGSQRRLVTWGSPDYPPLLARIADAPLVLYVEGDVTALHVPQLAIVGSRAPTAPGRETARQFAQAVGRAGLGVTSGLALGIDAAAHRGALDAGARTVAVVGRGLEAVYPPENTGLAAEIVAGRGALVSDFPIGTPPLPHHFPRRNRVLSGLAVGTLVVEAALRSGSLITARLAADQGREVFAVPGSIHSPLSRGCHHLLRQGAHLVESIDDIFAELAQILPDFETIMLEMRPVPTEPAAPPLDKDYEILLDALGFEPAGLDELVVRTALQAGAVASMLLILELEGRVQQQPGGRYSRQLPGKV